MGISTAVLEVSLPVIYGEMPALFLRSAAVITDSGGLQEETTALGIPCLTLRDHTECPITITEGTNQLVTDMRRIPALVEAGGWLWRVAPEGWMVKSVRAALRHC